MINPALFAMMGSQELVTETFTSSTTWNAPYTTSALVTLTGEGQDGTNDYVSTQTVASATVRYFSSGTTGTPGTADWTNAQSAADSNQAAANAGGSVTIQELVLDKYADGTQADSITNTYHTDVVAGTASTAYFDGWQSTGAITASGRAEVSFDKSFAGSAGSNTTGFSKTFPGGAANTAATPATYNDVAVTPGAAYTLVIPAGGSITITYYK